MDKDHLKRVATRVAILLLIFAIAGLSAMAKQNKYLPKSNPAHFLDKATKVDVPHQPVPFIPARCARLPKLFRRNQNFEHCA